MGEGYGSGVVVGLVDGEASFKLSLGVGCLVSFDVNVPRRPFD